MVFCEFLEKIADAYAATGRPITLVLDNARYQKCQSVADKAKELGIELFTCLPILPTEFDRTVVAIRQKAGTVQHPL